MKKTNLTVILILLTGIMHGQLSENEFARLLETKDVVILYENTKISLDAKKATFIEVVVEKEIEYQILRSSGNDKINPLKIPEPFDEVYKPHNSEIRNASRIFDEVIIHSFSATLIDSDGDIADIEYEVNTSEYLVITSEERFGSVFTYNYAFRDLEPGEIIRLKYLYSFPYIYNFGKIFSSRVFLETNIPRKRYDLTLMHNARLEVDTYFANGASPQKLEDDQQVIYNWKYKNQPGCIGEPGSRPHVNIPWFTFTPKPYELIYQHFNSFIEEFIPFWYVLSFEREAKIRKAYVASYLGVKNRDNLHFERTALRFDNMVPNDTTGRTKLRYFQRYIVDSVRYDDAEAMYKRLEGNRKLSPGTDLYSGFVREPNKESIYAGMLPRMGCQFFTAYVDDVRSGYVFEDYYAPVYDNELLIAAVTEDDKIMFIIPKSDKRNLYCEELPFYYESAPALMLFTYDFAGYRRNFNDVLRIIVTPGSEAKDNCRRVNSMVKVNLKDNKLLFETRLSLSGQYSTLTYPVYNDWPVDETINPKYLCKFWEIADDPEVEYVRPNGKKIVFPFNSSVNAKYSITGLNRKNDSIVELDLGGWTKHVYYPDLDTAHRYTDFFADFLGSDTFTYMIVFDAPVSLVEQPDLIRVDNDFGVYNFSIEQTDERNILLSSFYLNRLPMVPKNEINKVAELYSAIMEAEQTTLLINIHD
jgi:hypothetical protein